MKIPFATSALTRTARGSVSASRTSVSQEITWSAALRAERLICICRAGFCAMVLVRFLLLDVDIPWQGYAVNSTALVLGIAYSLWMLRSIRHNAATPLSLRTSVVLDAVICVISLLQTALWPGVVDYTGILARPDAAAMLIIIFAAGIRLFPELALISGALHAVGFAAIVVVERQRHAATLAYGHAELSLFVVLLATVTILAVATASRTRRLVTAAELATGRVERARHQLTHLMRDQHDARSLLSAATVHADLIGQALSQSGVPDDHESRRMTKHLQSDLAFAKRCLHTIGEQAFAHLATLQGVRAVDCVQTVSAVIAASQARYPALCIRAQLSALPHIEVAGGQASLERILFNLVVNAVEGDGKHGASNLFIDAVLEPSSGGRRRLHIAFRDDGPGFPATILAGEAQSVLSTKPTGSGLGLYAIARIMQLSGGAFTIGDVEGGARVQLSFDAVAASTILSDACRHHPV